MLKFTIIFIQEMTDSLFCESNSVSQPMNIVKSQWNSLAMLMNNTHLPDLLDTCKNLHIKKERDILHSEIDDIVSIIELLLFD